MPNGGVPLHMAITPRDGGPYVVYCNAAAVSFIAREDWEERKSAAAPVFTLSRAEVEILERFIRYWLRDTGEGPIYRSREADVIYDF